MGDKIRYYSHVHIGVAVAVDEGLLVPVVRFADQKSFEQIGTEVREYAKSGMAQKSAEFTKKGGEIYSEAGS